MKQFFTLLFVLSFFSGAGFSQGKTRYSYLTVSLESRREGLLNSKWYLELVTDKGNPNAAVIDSLVNYRDRASIKTAAEFYHQRKDSSHVFYNYFRSVEEYLDFMDDHGWQLVSVVGYASATSGDIRTNPVYYFRKER